MLNVTYKVVVIPNMYITVYITSYNINITINLYKYLLLISNVINVLIFSCIYSVLS